MKKLITLLLVAVFSINFYGCSKKGSADILEDITETTATEDSTVDEDESDEDFNEIDGYEYADFEKYNSYAKNNGLKDTPVYIKGNVKSVHEHEGICMLSIVSEDEGRWIVALLGVQYSDGINELLDEKSVVCFGNYRGFSDIFQMPSFYADKVEVGIKTYTIEDFIKFNEDTPTEPITEKPTATEKDTKSAQKELIYNENGFEIYYIGKEVEEDEGQKFNLEIHNNSGLDLELTTMNTSVNDYVVNPIFRVNIPNGKIANEAIYFMSSTLEKNNISQIDELEFTLLFYDPNSSITDENRVNFTSQAIIIHP